MKYWKGYWIVAVSVLHTIVAIVQFNEQYMSMLAAGLVNSVVGLHAGVAVWFFLFGVLMLVAGLLVLALEKSAASMPILAVYALLLLTVLGVATMPVSGFWLLFPPIIAFIFQRT